MRAEEMVEEFPVLGIESPALDAFRLLAEHRFSALVVGTGKSDEPYAVLPSFQVVRFLVPVYVQYDPGLAGVLTESMADRAADRLSGKTIRDLMPHERQRVPVVEADDTFIEVAEVMSRMQSPLVIVVKDGSLRGVITASRLLAAVLNH